MKTVVVLGHFPPPLTGQALATQRAADLLRLGGFDVRTIALGHNAMSDPPLRRLALQALTIRRLRANLKQLSEADAVVWASLSASVPGHLRDLAVARLLPLAKTIGWVNWGQFDELLGSRWLGRSSTQLVERLGAVAFVEPFLAELARRHALGMNEVVMPNALTPNWELDAEELQARVNARVRRRREGEPVRILYLGALIPSKGFPSVVQAHDRLREQGHHCITRLVGAWPTRRTRAHWSPRLSHVAGLELVGGVSAEAVCAHLDWADVMAFPSAYPTEAQPLVILEAMSRGVPIITSGHRALPDIVSTAGRIVPADDIPALAAAIVEVTAATNIGENSLNAHRRYSAQYSSAVTIERWRELVSIVAAKS